MKPIVPAENTLHVRYAIRDIVVYANKLKQEKDLQVLSLNIGDPCKFDFSPPAHTVESIYKAMRENHNGYSPAYGIPEALEALNREAGRKGLRDVKHIFVTTGASEAIEICLTSLLNKGDNVLIPYPQYPLYSAVINKLGAQANPYLLAEDNDWQPNMADMAARVNDKTRAIVVINPNNPTGSVYSKEVLKDIIALAKQHGLLIFADEIYDKLILDDRPFHSLASLDSEAPVVTFGGLAKNFIAPGWRIGWGYITGAGELVHDYSEAVSRLLRARLCANHPMQFAIQPALEGPQDHIEAVREKLRRRRDIMADWIARIDHLSVVKPAAAFYAFPRIALDVDDEQFVKGLLAETGVLVVPGKGFGQAEGSAHFRLVYLPQEDVLHQAFARIEEYIRKHYG